MSKDCIFCKIAEGAIPSDKVYEDEKVLAFKDINPAAPVHVLVIPKEHIETLEDLNKNNIEVVQNIHMAIQGVAKKSGINENGYRVIVNCGKDGGQVIPHLHYHVLGGAKFGEKII